MARYVQSRVHFPAGYVAYGAVVRIQLFPLAIRLGIHFTQRDMKGACLPGHHFSRGPTGPTHFDLPTLKTNRPVISTKIR